MAAFLGNKEISSRSEEHEYQYQSPATVSGTNPEAVSGANDPLPALAPSTVSPRGGSDATQTVVGSFTPIFTIVESPVQNSNQEGDEYTSQPAQPEGDPRKKHAAVAFQGVLIPSLKTADGSTAPANLKVDWKKKLCIGCAVVCIFSVILSLAGALVCTLIQHHQQEWRTTHKAEILQGDTILAYHGSDPRVEFTACFEETDADNPTRQLDVTLIAVHCEHLVEHNQTLKRFDYPIKSKDIFEELIYVPGGYNHYESGSTFVFWVESQNVPESSGLFIRVFDNTAEADSYQDHPTDTNARHKAIWTKQVETNISFNVTFNPPYASYFIPTFEANIAGGNFEFTMSYSIRQIYYQYSDYAKNVAIRCVLNSSNPCYFHLSEWNETCILAYNPPSYTDDTNAVVLTTQRHTSVRRHVIHRKISHPLWTFFLLFVVCSLCVLYFSIRYCKCSCKHVRKGYAPVVMEEGPSLVDSTITESDNG